MLGDLWRGSASDAFPWNSAVFEQVSVSARAALLSGASPWNCRTALCVPGNFDTPLRVTSMLRIGKDLFDLTYLYLLCLAETAFSRVYCAYWLDTKLGFFYLNFLEEATDCQIQSKVMKTWHLTLSYIFRGISFFIHLKCYDICVFIRCTGCCPHWLRVRSSWHSSAMHFVTVSVCLFFPLCILGYKISTFIY